MQISATKAQHLASLGITTVYLFGSRAQGIAQASSDYDVGLLLRDPSVLRQGTEALYLSVYDVLQELVAQPVNIDIVFLDQAPLQLRYHVIRYGQVLHDSDAVRRGRFEQRTLEEHADFEPYRRMFEEATLARIP